MRCKTGGTRLSRPPAERGTQGAFHSAPRAEGVRWGTVATSATLPRDHPGGDNGRDALVASAYGTWNNVEHRGHPIQRHAQRAFDGARSRQARPSRATIPEETTGGTRLSRPPAERRTQGTFHPAPRAEGGAGTSRADAVLWGTVATSATLPRADAVRWGTVATSATLPRDHPGGDKREGRACRVRLRNVASARATRLGKPHATRLGQKTKPDANTHLAERDWRREGDLNPRYGD